LNTPPNPILLRLQRFFWNVRWTLCHAGIHSDKFVLRARWQAQINGQPRLSKSEHNIYKCRVCGRVTPDLAKIRRK
jgi:hypothetical protein